MFQIASICNNNCPVDASGTDDIDHRHYHCRRRGSTDFDVYLERRHLKHGNDTWSFPSSNEHRSVNTPGLLALPGVNTASGTILLLVSMNSILFLLPATAAVASSASSRLLLLSALLLLLLLLRP